MTYQKSPPPVKPTVSRGQYANTHHSSNTHYGIKRGEEKNNSLDEKEPCKQKFIKQENGFAKPRLTLSFEEKKK